MSPRVQPPDLVLVHLSDIHFRAGRLDDIHDQDRDVRNELLKDLRAVRAELGRIDAILVTGDIAFAGKKSEYDFAKVWLESVREELGCPPANVLVTPGNHDVDRDEIPAGGDVEAFHDQVRNCQACADADDVLARLLRDPAHGPALLQPVAAYNDFARGYGCAIDAQRPFWERDFALGDRTCLRLRGISTTFISGPRDDDRANRLFYGGAQRLFLREPNIRHAVAGHHPPASAVDGEEADRHFSERTCIQLFGHKHDQWIVERGTSVRLISGALHPARGERQWEPRYNALTIRAGVYNRTPILEVVVYPRRWSAEETTFIPDYNSDRKHYRQFRLEVPSATAERSPITAKPPVEQDPENPHAR